MISGVRWISFLARSSRLLGKREEPAVLSVFLKHSLPLASINNWFVVLDVLNC
jgi:hypothetical protein